MNINFDPLIANAGGYDYLVDFLRNTVRQARVGEASPDHIEQVNELLNAVTIRVEQAAQAYESADSPARAGDSAGSDLDDLVRRLSTDLGA